jgi:uncharacterized membrane protein
LNFGEFLKLAHLLLVVVGIGGMIGLHVVLPLTARASEIAAVRLGVRLARVLDNVAGAGLAIGGLLGLWLSIYQEWDFGENTWLNIGATLWIVVLLMGALLQRRSLARLQEMADAAPGPGQPPELEAAFRKPVVLFTPMAITTILIVIVFLMVAKPGVDFTGIDNWPVNT